MGTGYVLFSMAIALLTYGVPQVKRPLLRGSLSYVLVLLAGFVALQLWQVREETRGGSLSKSLEMFFFVQFLFISYS